MPPALSVSDGKEICVLLLGKTGHGKSATGNTILGREEFRKSDKSDSKTKTATLKYSEREDGTFVRVVDAPGVMDTEGQEESTISDIMQGMGLCPNGFHALVFVTSYGIRNTGEEINSLEILKKYFGSNFIKDFGMVVMTHGDGFDLNHEDDNLTFDSWLTSIDKEEQSGPIDKLLEECNKRCVLFYNSGKQYINQRNEGVKKFFHLVEQIPSVYTSHHLELAKAAREELAKISDTPVLYTSVLEKLSLLMDQIVKDLKNNTFSYEFMLKKVKDLNEEVDDVGKKIKKSLVFSLLKESIDSILPSVEAINEIGVRGKQKAKQERLLKELQSLSEPPTTLQIFIREAYRILADLLHSPIFLMVPFDGHNWLQRPQWIQRIKDSYNNQKALLELKRTLHEQKEMSNHV